MFTNSTLAAPKTQEPTVKYRAAKDLDFEALLIEGQNKRPEISIVTGDSDQSLNGLLRLREHFRDKMTADLGEEPK